MSESEKKRRGIYRKNREKWIFAQSVIIAVVAIAVLISGLVSYQLNEKYYIGYTERGNIDYDVYLKENEFYDSPYLEKDQSYVASLIDRIITSFSYQIDMDTMMSITGIPIPSSPDWRSSTILPRLRSSIPNTI